MPKPLKLTPNTNPVGWGLVVERLGEPAFEHWYPGPLRAVFEAYWRCFLPRTYSIHLVKVGLREWVFRPKETRLIFGLDKWV